MGDQKQQEHRHQGKDRLADTADVRGDQAHDHQHLGSNFEIGQMVGGQ